jgi:hypothetical protein
MNIAAILDEPADRCAQRAYDGADWMADLCHEFKSRLAYHDARGLIDDALALAASVCIQRALATMSWVNVEKTAQRLREAGIGSSRRRHDN